MGAPPLSRRLDALLALVGPCGTLVDVGCDHALVALAAVHRGVAASAIGVDRKPEPLRAAAANVAASGLSGRVALRLGDGLAPVSPGEADALVVAGMGGRAIARILEAHPDTLSDFKQLILQPNQAPEAVRAWARGAGWHLAAEALVAEDDRYFPLLKLVPGVGPDPAYGGAVGTALDDMLRLGPRLVAGRSVEAIAHAHAQAERLARLAARRAGADVGDERAFWARAIALLAPRR